MTDTGGMNLARVCISKDDRFTDTTARFILDNNEIGERLYGWKPCKAGK